MSALAMVGRETRPQRLALGASREADPRDATETAGALSHAIVPCEACGRYVQGEPQLTPARLCEGGFIWRPAPHICQEVNA